MMKPGQDYAPCPHCTANNVTYRQTCWRCGHVLPYTIGIDGRPRVNREAISQKVNPALLQELLDQAQVVDVTEAKRRAAEEQSALTTERQATSEGLGARMLSWLGLRKQHETEA